MKANTQPPATARILRLPEVAARIGMSRSSVYLLMNRGQFPKSVKLSLRAVGWRESEIDEWANSRPSAA
ncbi:helix-turn-helix transcriptional regulator [Thiocystis violascens]|uniref:Putative transcriptional regulator n=1 Tax=Thiocystis violascens (strain ATCC 17096 / DSM 198 / 6111) TaxID=765911 RepID=I3YBE1_THIV6|nr:AlpA family transcriptional regulator [Thiocystis violascens]AFL74309.1 putative transcriptional regulator [Thiocystis violascens DSM 198]